MLMKKQCGNKEKLKPQHGRMCPYWALERNDECGMVKGGMYIPMPEHVRMFCLSAKYSQCRQYITGCDLMNNQTVSEKNTLKVGRDRRKLQRFAEQLPLHLVVCDINVEPRIINTYKTKTLDVSVGGLRMESPRKLNVNTIVSFELDPDFSSESLLGVGEVKWCELQNGSEKFEFGMAFADHSTSKCMGEYLELL
jgi:hypothetical protein